MWEVRFTHPLMDSLSVEEVLAMPQHRDRVVWASGDATLDRVAGIDWSSKRAFSCEVSPLKEALSAFIAESAGEEGVEPQEEGSGFIIAITELLAVVALTSLRAEAWRGHIILYAGDNQTVIRWLGKRQARHPVATYLLQILSAVEAANGFRLHGAFIRTYHNVTADALTREDAALVMKDKQLQELPNAMESLRLQLDRGWQRRALVWAGQADADTQQALRLVERRGRFGKVPETLPIKDLLGLQILDLSKGENRYAREGLLLGAEVVEGFGAPRKDGTSPPLGVFQSLEPVNSESIQALCRGVTRARPAALWIDVRTEDAGKRVARALKDGGWKPRIFQVSGRTLRDQSWWRRWVVLGAHTEHVDLPCTEASQEPCTPIPKFFSEWFADPEQKETLQGTLQLDPTMPFLGANSPKPCGSFISHQEGEPRKLVWDPRRPLPGLHTGSWDPNHKDPLLLLSQGKEGPRVKVVTPQEVCFLLNGKFGPKDNGEASKVASASLIAAPPSLARLGLSWFAENSRPTESSIRDQGDEARFAPGPAGGERAGLCSLPWEEHTEEVLAKWLADQAKSGDNPMRVGGRKPRLSQDELASKALSKVLRHEAGTEECPISPEGWVKWKDIVQHPLCRRFSEDLLEKGVTHNSKERFVAKQDENGEWVAAAWSGHTIAGVAGPSREVKPSETPEVLVHGTYRQHVPSIQKRGLVCNRRDLHLQDPQEHAYRWRKDLEVKVVVDVRKAEQEGCRFRRTGNLIWLTSQTIPPSAITGFEEWDDLRGAEASAPREETPVGGLWEPKPEEWVNPEDPKAPVTVTQDVVEVAKALAEAAESVPDGKAIKVDTKTFATEICKEEDEAESELSDKEECDWEPSTESEAEVVQATAAKAPIEEEQVSKMEVEEDPAPPRRRRRLQLGSAQILLLKSIGDADADNWTSLQQCIQEHGTSGGDKSELLKRLEQLADLRQQSRQGAIIALQEERDRAWRVSRAEDLYRAELDEEMARLEKHNPVGPAESGHCLRHRSLEGKERPPGEGEGGSA